MTLEEYDGPVLQEQDLQYFLSGLDHRIEQYLRASAADPSTGLAESELYLVSIGGDSLLLQTDQEVRPANDSDLAVQHTYHPNDSRSWLEGEALESAFAMYGFYPRVNGRYEPPAGSNNVFENAEQGERGAFMDWFEDRITPLGDVRDDEQAAEQLWREYSGNDLPIPKADVFAGEKVLGSWFQDWLQEYAVPVTINGRTLDHITVLDLPALTARKVYRATVDNDGPEDDAQAYDLGTIYDYVRRSHSNSEQAAFRDAFNEAWTFLCAANPDDLADYHARTGTDPRPDLPEDMWDQLVGRVQAREPISRIREDIDPSDWTADDTPGWRYFKQEKHRKPPSEH